MPWAYAAATKDARMNAVVTALGTAGKLEICSAAYAAVLASFTLNNPAGTVSNGVLTFSGMPKDVTASAAGTAAIARLRTSANADVVIDLTVAVSGANINLAKLVIGASDTVRISSLSLTHG